MRGAKSFESEQVVLVYVTVPNESEAARLGQEVVSQRLAACANIVPVVRSFYWWDGAVQDDQEALLLLKSRASLVEQLRAAIISLHPYDVPAVSVLSVEQVHEPYLLWLIQETKRP